MSLLTLFKRILSRNKDTKAAVSDGGSDRPPIRHDRPTRARLLVSSHFDDDPLVEAMRRWLVALHGELPSGTKLLVGEDASAANVERWLRQDVRDPVMVVFYGHGERDGFVTHKALGKRGNPKFSYLCVASDFKRYRDLLVVAYCCLVGNQMVHDISRLASGRSISFRGEIGFVVGTAEREHAFSAPMRKAVIDIAHSDHIDELALHDLRTGYLTERKRWLPGGEHERDGRAMLIAIFLKQHANLVQVT